MLKSTPHPLSCLGVSRRWEAGQRRRTTTIRRHMEKNEEVEEEDATVEKGGLGTDAVHSISGRQVFTNATRHVYNSDGMNINYTRNYWHIVKNDVHREKWRNWGTKPNEGPMSSDQECESRGASTWWVE